MTRPLKPGPSQRRYRFFDLLTGKNLRVFSLPPKTAWHINQHLKSAGVEFRIYLTEIEQEALDERSK